jgi:tRNA nucleotidyltransferase (CCA-adding enzyme)
MQFAARFGFKIEEKSCILSRNISLDDLPKGRLFSEFEKMFMGKYLHYGLYYLFALGIAHKLFNETMELRSFLVLSRTLQKSQKNFIEKLRPYYFLFISSAYFHSGMKRILDRLGAPNRYYQKLDMPRIPNPVTVPFVANVSLKEGIIEYAGNYDPKVIMIAKKLDVWEKPFNRGVTPIQLMKEGFSGKALGDELERRTQLKINRLKEK